LTTLNDALFATHAGADYLGFILVEKSPRYISPVRVSEIIKGLPPQIKTVGVFMNRAALDVVSVLDETGLDIAQLHGSEKGEDAYIVGVKRVWKACSLTDEDSVDAMLDFPADQLLIDTTHDGQSGGTGKTGNWPLARQLAVKRSVMLAGGLTPDNVCAAIKQVVPFGVDVSSGVEISPGVKNRSMVEDFIKNAKGIK